MSLIVIEGLDGSGKSTQVKRLKKHFEDNNIRYKYLHFPKLENGIFGEMVAKFLRGEFGSIEQVDPYIVAMLYAEDRNDSKDEINKWIEEGYIVLLDRYVNSNIAFQCAKTEDKTKLKEWILNLEYNHFKIPKPDLEIFLNVPHSFVKRNLNNNRTGDDREYLNGAIDIHEVSMDFQKQVQDVYLSLCETQDNLHKINCSDGNEEMGDPIIVFNKIINILKTNIL